MKRLTALITTFIILLPVFAFAQQSPMLPKGRWWKMPEVTKRLNLTTEQQQRLDSVFTERSKELIDLKASMEKAAIELRSRLENTSSKPAEVMKVASEVGEARSLLFQKEIEMMLDIRAELDDEQWTKLRTALDDRANRLREQRPRPEQRPNQPPRN